MTALLIIGILLFTIGGICVFISFDYDAHRLIGSIGGASVVIGGIMLIISSGSESFDSGYKKGQSDYIEGKIMFQQIIKNDTTYIEIK